MRTLKLAIFAVALLAPVAAAADPACQACWAGCDSAYPGDDEAYTNCVVSCYQPGGACMATIGG